MSDTVLVALIVAAGPLALGIFNVLMNRKRHVAQVTATQDLEHKINSRMDEFIEQVKLLAHAAGVKQEQDAQQLRDRERELGS